MTIKEYKRNARFATLSEYDFFAKPEDYIEVTEWYNGEGFDVQLSTQSGQQCMSFTWGEYKALRAVIGNWFDDEDDEDDDDD